MAPPIIINIEASGFGKGSYPIEVGYISRHGHPWCSLVTPGEEWVQWDAAAESLHKVSRNILLKHGKDAKVVANHLNDVFHHQTVYTDGWSQDYTWINLLFNLAEVTPRFKLKDLNTILTPYQKSVWQVTKQSILYELQLRRHRASADAQVLQLTWIKTAEKESCISQKK